MTTAHDTPVLDTLAAMTLDSMERCGLTPEALILTRIAALVAMDAPPLSYVAHFEAGAATDLRPEQVQDVLVAIAPVVGTARVMAAAGHITKALGIEITASAHESDV
ncbi:carboxymuconolactone decarboxylase [Embleya sp. NPDC020630]|uniref:carboxymuconolactone decarboxylase n=1 Tax=Embleya sp. NPDC020630 TaxID=3363979 RepID=UPI00379DAEE7